LKRATHCGTLLWMKKRRTILSDSLIFLFCIGAIALISSRTLQGGSGYVQVQSEKATFRYSLENNREITVDGPLGQTHIVIEDGKAHIMDSACPTKSCTHQSPIFRSNSWIACLPNMVLLTIVGNEDELEVDDVAN